MVYNRVGETRKNTSGQSMKILDYYTNNNMRIIILDTGEIKSNVSYKEFYNGKIKSNLTPSVYGIGYFGIGIHKGREKGKKIKKYNTWIKMLQRCYSEEFHKKRPSYKECIVSEEWHNFQTFGDWFDENCYSVDEEKMCLDKDILIKGNKVYSSDTCIFVPERINALFTKTDAKRGNNPIGVNYNFNRVNHSFSASCSSFNNGKKIKNNLGYFKTPEEAFESYKIFKEDYIKQVADEYKDRIPEKLYDAMYEWKIEITD